MGDKGLKCVLMGVLVLGLVLEQVQVEGKSCCKNTTARNCYNACRLPGTPRPVCASTCGCKIIDGKKCPPDYPKFNLLPSSGEPNAIEYCSLGCRSSTCDNMNTVDGSEESEVTVEYCNDACNRFCNGYAGLKSVAA